MTVVKLPPFASVIKSRAVEDPVNLWLHRPLAYAFVGLTLRTPLTPNQITLMAVLSGLGAAALWLWGTPSAMLAGGILLWTSAILDGADGIMARAKKLFSDFGRALDGSADMIVAAASVVAAFVHIWQVGHNTLHLALMPLALLTAVAQINLYDFYKECYLNSTNPDWDGITTSSADVRATYERHRDEGASWLTLFAWNSYAGMMLWQDRLRSLVNPASSRDGLRFVVNEQTTAIFRKHNHGPMQVWTLVSLCPHTYLMAIAAMADRLDLYLWFRIIPGNLLFLLAIIWQRHATRKTRQELKAINASPIPMECD